ncbi:MAG: RDD family protein [Rhodospirillaceae bacterium]|nr:RDD family protein [Rhodospirillaceae bacterium]
MIYARITQRVMALFVDGIVLLVLTGFLEVIGLPVYDHPLLADGSAGPVLTWSPLGIAVSILTAGAYFVGLECSPYQGTLGKVALGLRVTDLEGGRIRPLRATVRYFAKYLSAAILMIGFFMAIFTRRRQALHDLIAGTVVIGRGI